MNWNSNVLPGVWSLTVKGWHEHFGDWCPQRKLERADQHQAICRSLQMGKVSVCILTLWRSLCSRLLKREEGSLW